jgi:hypothetical protein
MKWYEKRTTAKATDRCMLLRPSNTQTTIVNFSYASNTSSKRSEDIQSNSGTQAVVDRTDARRCFSSEKVDRSTYGQAGGQQRAGRESLAAAFLLPGRLMEHVYWQRSQRTFGPHVPI